MKKTVISSLGVFIFLSGFLILSVAATEIPSGYSEDADLESIWTYKISEANGVVVYFNWDTFETIDCAIEKDGAIEFEFVDFYNGEPYFNIKFITADEIVNTTLTNVSNSDIASTLTLSMGFFYFTPGIFTQSTEAAWTSQDAVATSIADGSLFSTSEYGTFYYNGSLSITDEKKLHIYEYSQDPATYGNQNTTLKYDKDTGVIQEFSTEFTGYHLSASLNSGFAIASFPLEIILILSSLSIGIFIRRKIKREL